MLASASPSSSSVNGEVAGSCAAGMTVIVDVLESFAGFESGLFEVTVAVFATTPGVCGRLMVSVIVALDTPVSDPMLHVTVVVPLHDPCDGTAETNVLPAGRTSVTVTPVAATPAVLFVTVIV